MNFPECRPRNTTTISTTDTTLFPTENITEATIVFNYSFPACHHLVIPIVFFLVSIIFTVCACCWLVPVCYGYSCRKKRNVTILASQDPPLFDVLITDRKADAQAIVKPWLNRKKDDPEEEDSERNYKRRSRREPRERESSGRRERERERRSHRYSEKKRGEETPPRRRGEESPPRRREEENQRHSSRSSRRRLDSHRRPDSSGGKSRSKSSKFKSGTVTIPYHRSSPYKSSR